MGYQDEGFSSPEMAIFMLHKQKVPKIIMLHIRSTLISVFEGIFILIALIYVHLFNYFNILGHHTLCLSEKSKIYLLSPIVNQVCCLTFSCIFFIFRAMTIKKGEQ